MKTFLEGLIAIATFVITLALVIAVMIYLWPLVLGAIAVWILIYLFGLIKTL